MAIFTGGISADTFVGGTGSDTILGNDGADTLAGGAGADSINGGNDQDYLYSADISPPFNAPYYGNPWTAPVLDTGSEMDTLIGGDGADRIFAGYGDTVDGGPNGVYGDYLYISFMGASSGVTADFRNATLTIGGGTITGIENISWVQGSDFGDTINVGSPFSGGYSDFTAVFGMGGNDQLTAGYYTGYMDGGAGDDIVDGRPSQYLQMVAGGDGNDTLYTATNTFAEASGGAGDDVIYGHGTIHGDAGNDTINIVFSYYPGAVYGDAGDDVIYAADFASNPIAGGAGSDAIFGGSADELISTENFGSFTNVGSYDLGAEHDVVSAGGGNDTIWAGIGDDVDGGGGNDVLYLSFGGATTGVTVNLAGITSGSANIAGGVIANIEAIGKIQGSAFNDSIVVSGLTVGASIDGGDGNDTVTGTTSSVTFLGGAGDDRFISGAAADSFDGGAGSDTVDYSGEGAGITITLNLTPGAVTVGPGGDQLQFVENIVGTGFSDTLTGNNLDNRLEGGEGGDTLSGLGSNDALIGGGGNDTLNGGTGNDTLDGGSGADSMTGGAGDDVYYIDDAGDQVVELAGEGTDTVRVARTSYTAAAEVEVLVATLSAGTSLTGNGLANRLEGNSGADTLSGGDGNDTLVGNGGADSLIGGNGDDTYQVDQAGVTLVESANGGTDTVRTSLAAFSLAGAPEIENLVYTGSGATTLTGSATDNRITGGAGADQLSGGGGNDTLDGGAGADSMAGGTGDDVYIVDNVLDGVSEQAGEGNDTVLTALTFYATNANVENLTYTGTAAATLAGNDLANRLVGGNGNDLLDGMGGADTMTGGLGDDSYTVNDPGDVVIEAAGGGTDTITLVNTFPNSAPNFAYVLPDNVENLSYLGVSAVNLSGNGLANRVTGGDGADSLGGGGGADTLLGGLGNDTLDGGAGGDSMAGGAGDDTYLVDDAADTITELANDGADTVLTTLATTVLAANVERLTFVGSGAAVLTGNSAGNVITGSSGDDRLIGLGGDDSLVGGTGNDTLTGGGGTDTIQGGAGWDVATFSATYAQSTVSLANGGGLTVTNAVDGTDTLRGIEQVRFTDGLYSFRFAQPAGLLVANFAPGAGGWSSQDLYPRHVADVNGDGRADIVGFGIAGTWVSLAGANGTFAAPVLAGSNFGQTAGWSTDNQYHRELADVNGDGRADVIGFGIAGTWISLASANGTYSDPSLALNNFGANQGWSSQNSFARTVGDVNGDGLADLVGFGIAGTWVALGFGDGSFQAAKLAVSNFGANQGWSSDTTFHRTLADVNGDGRKDVVGFGIAGTWVALATSDGTFGAATFATSNFGAAQGWSSNDSFPRFAADVNGDGFADLVGFGAAGTFVAFGKGDGSFTEAGLDLFNFSQAQGWSSDATFHREVADINGDGRVDIVGFGNAGVYAGLNQGDLVI